MQNVITTKIMCNFSSISVTVTIWCCDTEGFLYEKYIKHQQQQQQQQPTNPTSS